MSEVKWSCGCHEVDGKLVQECTQSAPAGELASHQLGRPFSPKCFRKAAFPKDHPPVKMTPIPVKPVGPAKPLEPQD